MKKQKGEIAHKLIAALLIMTPIFLGFEIAQAPLRRDLEEKQTIINNICVQEQIEVSKELRVEIKKDLECYDNFLPVQQEEITRRIDEIATLTIAYENMNGKLKLDAGRVIQRKLEYLKDQFNIGSPVYENFLEELGELEKEVFSE